ncbi:MAG TPA: NAD-dependent epimerase/dehydratase family protein [Thermoanaerobaculia bacterium]|nr:NAD-dependent epimerase/dehydratase family protein [Thermoanaerobaculia bacterium]
MKVLVTGGTGVVGAAAVRALLADGHAVRLFSRHADKDVERWRGTGDIEAREGSIGSPLDIAGAAEGCDAILHIAGIVEERPPEVTFDRVNVGGTQHLLSEAQRAGVRRFVYVSSLGAERGDSAYHSSKRRAEDLVLQFPGDWLICRPGNVYGPGDEVISLLLQMVRISPVVPVIDAGDQPFQPLYAEDLGAALAIAVSRKELSRQVLLLAGDEVTTTSALIDRLARITGREAARLPVPSFFAKLGAQAASMIGLRMPVNEDKLTMLIEENVIRPGEVNALTTILGVKPTPLEEGLRRLAVSQPEQLPSGGTGTGPVMRRRYWANLHGIPGTAKDLFTEFRRRFFDVVPEATVREGGEQVGERRLDPGAVLTLSLPMRGHVQVRVVEVTDTSATLVTLAGHPLAGSNTFRITGVPTGTPSDAPHGGLRFVVESCDRPSNLVDGLAMTPMGTMLKHWTWNNVVEEAAKMFGARPPIDVQMEEHALEGEAERQAIREMEEKVANLAREQEPALQEEAKARLEEASVGKI